MRFIDSNLEYSITGQILYPLIDWNVFKICWKILISSVRIIHFVLEIFWKLDTEIIIFYSSLQFFIE